MVPTKLFITKGVGTHKEDKNARDAASRQAGVGQLNIVNVSSVLTPGITLISREEFEGLTTPGEIVHAIHGVTESNVPGQKVTVGLAIVRPWNKSKAGFVAELFGKPGIQEDIIGRRVETMALQLFADENQIEFTADDVWEPGKSTYQIGNEKVQLDSYVASGIANLDGDYTCAMVLAFLLP